MKGPSGRGKHDVSRVWECPLCNRRSITTGVVVHLTCPCGDQCIPERTIWMRLIEDNGERRRVSPTTGSEFTP